MTPLGSSSSAGESSMDNTSNTTITTNPTVKHKLKQARRNPPITLNNKRKNCGLEDEEPEEECDPEAWQSFNTSFGQVQSVLDRNRVLIQQVNENHQSKIPDNMVKNVGLIQELNGNISKVVSLYSDLSTNFSRAFHQRNKDDDGRSESWGDLKILCLCLTMVCYNICSVYSQVIYASWGWLFTMRWWVCLNNCDAYVVFVCLFVVLCYKEDNLLERLIVSSWIWWC